MANELKSLSKGLRVYREIVFCSKPILAHSLCKKLNINKSTMSRILKTLKDEDYIEYCDKTNEITAKSIEDEEIKLSQIQVLIKKTKFLLEEIHDITGECAYLGILDNNKLLYINQIDKSSRKIKTRNNIGLSTSLHTSALGKTILAFGNYDIKKLKLNQYTVNTITDTKDLEITLKEVQEKAYAIDNSEYQDNMACVAVPLFNHENILIAALGISASKSRISLNKLHEIGKTLSKLVSSYKIVS
ncbi:MAG: hypothetical protein HRT40_08140 [Campylobacteraceae bacterium]|nr:hypothetical protein [Campylobacteraceae bacterium]